MHEESITLDIVKHVSNFNKYLLRNIRKSNKVRRIKQILLYCSVYFLGYIFGNKSDTIAIILTYCYTDEAIKFRGTANEPLH